MAIRSIGGRTPRISDHVFIDESAVIIGDVELSEGCSVWPGAVIRADDDSVSIGEGSAIMDMAFAEAPKGKPVMIGPGCIVSHGARLHGCVLKEGVLVGIGAIVLDGVSIGKGSIIAAGTVLTPDTNVPENTMMAGVPGRVLRNTTEEERQTIHEEVRNVREKALRYKTDHAPR
ncbi:MAG: gamma carbonic anhydrase family protein [Thermoplasmata archaeon]|nr:gamma carbonic anhydrase family protein [Thermoplasmata archaeon]MCJ7562232.1 gamma carbonic anhydrase family protein [Thermoplasmata archaeon]TFG70929.1 MAG: gamma carbonic anhydrase family protein [Methanomassiliicoccus sp.]